MIVYVDKTAEIQTIKAEWKPCKICGWQVLEHLGVPVVAKYRKNQAMGSFRPRFCRPGGRLNIKMPSYQYRNSHVKDKTVSPTVISLTWESPYLGKTVFILKQGPEPLLSVHTLICYLSHGVSRQFGKDMPSVKTKGCHPQRELTNRWERFSDLYHTCAM